MDKDLEQIGQPNDQDEHRKAHLTSAVVFEMKVKSMMGFHWPLPNPLEWTVLTIAGVSKNTDHWSCFSTLGQGMSQNQHEEKLQCSFKADVSTCSLPGCVSHLVDLSPDKPPKEGRVYSGSQLGSTVHPGKAVWWKDGEAAGHIIVTVGKQRGVTAVSGLAFSFVCWSQPSHEWDSATYI